MVSMGSLPARVGGGADGASRGNAVNWPGARPNGNCGAEKPGACRGVRNDALPPRTGRYSLKVGAHMGSARSGTGATGGPWVTAMYPADCGRPPDPADVAGTARGEQNPSGAQEIPSPASPKITAESVARGIALAANAYFDPRAQQDDAEESGAGGSDGALEIAGRPLRYEEDRAPQENGDGEIAAAEADAAGNVRAPDPAGQRGGLTRPEQGPTSTPASRQPPLARHPPRPLRESFAICLLTPLLHLAKNLDSSPGWKLLMFLPRILLRSSSARKPDWKAMGDRLTRFRQGLWRDLYNEAADAVTNNPQPHHVPDTTGKLARAEGLAKRGNLAKSLQSLTATPVCTPSAEVLRALTVRHPEASLAIPDWVHDFASETVPSIRARTTFEHLRDAALGNADVFVQLHALTNTALAGKLSAEAADLLTASRLLAFSKPQGGTRPIAVGECLLHLIAKAALFIAAPAAREHFIPLQFGVAIAGGIEAAIHTACTYLEEFPGATALQIDLANAFNASARGVRQGDPLGPMLFAASIHSCLVTTAAAHPEVVLLAYADDITCEAWSAIALDSANLPPGINISLDGVRVLGSPIRPPTGCAVRVRERLSAATELLPLLSQMDPQLCLLLLTRCVSRRASFLVRATPLEALPLGEWSTWGEELLHTYLAAAHTKIPRNRAERDKIWQQAALPASLGGLGITNPAVEGGFAYLASVVSAAHLLRSFGDSANPALTGLLPLMDADEESTSLLPGRLAALEAELPPDGIEALQVGKQKPNGGPSSNRHSPSRPS
ncbi:unnamed protein product [Closterium sp. NIES-54]